MTLRMPPLPEPNGYDDRHTEEQLQAVQIAAARAALEEAAKVAADMDYGLAIAAAIRAITIEGEKT